MESSKTCCQTTNCDSSSFRLLCRNADAAIAARNSRRSSVARDAAPPGSPATRVPRSRPSDSRGNARIRATGPWVQPIGGSLPITRRACIARRQMLASGSLSIARVQTSLPLRQQNSTRSLPLDSPRWSGNTPITTNSAPRPFPFSALSVQLSARLDNNVSTEAPVACVSRRRRVMPRSALRRRAFLCSSSIQLF